MPVRHPNNFSFCLQEPYPVTGIYHRAEELQMTALGNLRRSPGVCFLSFRGMNGHLVSVGVSFPINV